MTAFLGIYREPICSPGRHRENDAAILELVAGRLEAAGHEVALASADEANRFARDSAVIFSMSRAPAVLELLSRLASDGRVIVNRPDAVLATARSRLAGRPLGAVSLPAAHVVPTARALRAAAAMPSGEWWVKGGDLYASRREDVQRVNTMAKLERTLDDFERRGISSAVLQEHVPGREVKFYAVGAAGFFHWLDTSAGGSTMPLQPAALNGLGDPGGRQPCAFQAPAVSAGAALALEIFGGDIVIGHDGRATLIDLNDWPSFAPCRDAAAVMIARYLEGRLDAAYTAVSSARPATPSASA